MEVLRVERGFANPDLEANVAGGRCEVREDPEIVEITGTAVDGQVVCIGPEDNLSRVALLESLEDRV